MTILFQNKSVFYLRLTWLNDYHMSLLRDPKVLHFLHYGQTFLFLSCLVMCYINNKLQFVGKTKEEFAQGLFDRRKIPSSLT